MAKILVVDDDTTLRRAVVRILTRAGHSVIDAADGQEGARIFREDHDIVLVLSDVNMPVMTGPAMHRAIAGELAARGVRFGFISDGHNSAPDREYVRASAIQTLPKPFGTDELTAFVAHLLAT